MAFSVAMQQDDFIPPPDSSGRVQFAWLNRFRKERRAMEIFLVNGHRVAGRIRSFDQRAILLETPGGESILVFHEVVSTVQPVSRTARRKPPRPGAARPGSNDTERPREPRRAPPAYEGTPDDDMPVARPPQPERKPVTIVRRTSRRIVRDDDKP